MKKILWYGVMYPLALVFGICEGICNIPFFVKRNFDIVRFERKKMKV